MAYTEWLLLFPPFLFIPVTITIATCFAVLYAMKGITRLKEEDVAHGKGSIVSLVFSAWGIDIGALLFSFVLMYFIGHAITYFGPIYGEMQFAGYDYVPHKIYTLCQVLLYAGLLTISYFPFRKKVKDKAKRNKMFTALFVISVLVWALFMCLAFRVF